MEEDRLFSDGAIYRLWIFSSFAMVIGVCWRLSGINWAAQYFPLASSYFSKYQFGMMGFFVHPLIASSIFLPFFVMSLFIIENKIVKIAIAIVSFVSLWLTITRTALLIAILGLIVWIICVKSKGLVLFERVRVSRYEDIAKEIEFCSNLGLKLIGVVVTE